MDLLSANGPSPRVLIVEDDPVSAMVIQRLFLSEGIQVDRATDGHLALKMHAQNRYRLIVSDWMMPEMSGVELCREFRSLAGPYVYFILCSAKGQKDERMEAFHAGVDDFLTKPLDREELRARLMVARRILSTEEHLQMQNAELERAGASLGDVNESLRLASRRFQELFEGLPVASFTFDECGLIHEWNRGAQLIFRIQAFEAFQRPIWEVLTQSDCAVWNQDRIRTIFLDDEHPSFDWTYRLADGTVKYLACSVICIRNFAGQAVGAVCANLDITERKLAEQQVAAQMIQINRYAEQLREQKRELEEMNAKLNHLAVTDGLTGLWNHRRFQEILEEALSDIRRHDEPFSLILMDIDLFKKYNDDFGHQVGDEVLVTFSDVLRRVARATEMPARYGGEEFAVILQRCDAKRALVAAHRFMEAIQSEDWPHRNLSASMGITTCTDGNASAKSIIAEADVALYHSKQTGRNRMTVYSDLAATEAA